MLCVLVLQASVDTSLCFITECAAEVSSQLCAEHVAVPLVTLLVLVFDVFLCTQLYIVHIQYVSSLSTRGTMPSCVK